MARVKESINQEGIKITPLTPKEEILQEIEHFLKRPLSKYTCMNKTQEDYERTKKSYCKIIGSNSLTNWKKLTSLYKNNSEEMNMLKELKERLENVYNYHSFQYNQRLALTICDYLLEKELNEKYGIRKNSSSL